MVSRSFRRCAAAARRMATALGLAALLPALALIPVAANATPMLLVEADSGRVLEQQEAGKPWYPASVTKLMTVYVALSAVKARRIGMDTPITVSALAASQAPSKMGFKPGTQVTLDNALKMVLVKSANDMAVVVAEGVGGSLPAFVEEMNATARHLGMTGTSYANPNGLPDPDQITTARDLAILARAIIYHFPEHEMLFRIPAIKIGKRVLRNYNRLIDRYPGADGMKTGFICNSGFNLVATATRGNKRLIAVVLGARSAVARTEETALLFEKGFGSGWGGIFGSAAPALSSIQNSGGPPTSMRDVVCGARRGVVAAENEDEQPGGGFSFARATPVSGAALLQNLPPSMPPIPVYVGTRNQQLDPDTAVAGADKPKKPARAAAKPAAKPATASATADGKPAPKPAAVSPAKPAAASAAGTKDGAKPASAAKPAAAKPAPAKPAPAKPAAAAKPKPETAPKPAT